MDTNQTSLTTGTADEIVTVAVITACRNSGGASELVLTNVELTRAELADGEQGKCAEALLEAARYERPFLHFYQDEMPAERWAGMAALAYTLPDDAKDGS